MSKRIPAPTDHSRIYDHRLQQRFITKGLWTFEMVNNSKKDLLEMPEAETVSFEEKQPAIGLFSPEELASVQKNFPYKK